MLLSNEHLRPLVRVLRVTHATQLLFLVCKLTRVALRQQVLEVGLVTRSIAQHLERVRRLHAFLLDGLHEGQFGSRGSLASDIGMLDHLF